MIKPPQLNRIAPIGPPQAYQTYSLRRPLATHWRRATCAEVACPNWERGWRTTLDISTPQGANNATWIKVRSGLHFTEQAMPPALVVFTFPPGQQCFEAASHRKALEREPLFIVRGGDHRGNPTGMKRTHRDAVAWRDDMGEHLDDVREQLNRG